MPVGAVAAAAHGPDDEGVPRLRLPEDDGGKSFAIFESFGSHRVQRVWECEGGQSAAAFERFATEFCQRIRQPEGGESGACSERTC